MNEVNKLLGQVKAAAGSLRDRISTLEDAIEVAYVERGKLQGEPLSQADYMAIVRLDIQRKSISFKEHLALEVDKDSLGFDYVKNDFLYAASYIPYLTAGSRAPHPMSEAAYHYYFEDLIFMGVERALVGKAWPKDAVPMAKRGGMIEAVDVRISGLMKERDALIESLLLCGVTQ
jgi:hypothetical protein